MSPIVLCTPAPCWLSGSVPCSPSRNRVFHPWRRNSSSQMIYGSSAKGSAKYYRWKNNNSRSGLFSSSRIELGAAAVVRFRITRFCILPRAVDRFKWVRFLMSTNNLLAYSWLVFKFCFKNRLVWQSCESLRQFLLDVTKAPKAVGRFWESLARSKQKLLK